MMASEQNFVRALPLFADVAEAHFRRLLADASLQRVPGQVVLVRQGDRPEFLHVAVEGSVELFATWENQETVIEILQPTAVFVLAPVIRDEPSWVSARTQTAARILSLPAQPIREIFESDPAFARAVAKETTEQCRLAVSALKDQKLRTSAERLANWILRIDRRGGRTGRLEIPYEKRILASRLGMTPENLSRNLAKLKHYGVSTQGREIVIDDRDALEPFARPDPLIDG